MKLFRISRNRKPLLTACMAVLLFLPLSINALDQDTGWHQPFVTLLDVNFPDTGFHARWEYFHGKTGDILLRLEQVAPDGTLTGEMLLIDGQVLLARGMVMQINDLEPMMQAPTLMLQLAFALLQIGFPEGPAAVSMDHDIDVSEDKQPVSIRTGMADGIFNAPWTIEGKTWVAGEAKRRFEFTFEFSNPLPDDADNLNQIEFSGGQDYGTDAFPLHDDATLEGWTMQWISRGEIEAVKPPIGLTLGELREEALGLSNPSS